MKGMKIVLGLIVAALVLAGISASLTGCQNAHEKSHVQKASAKQYRCPMHPQVVSDRPGSCPICHMRLVLVESDAKLAQAEKPMPVDPDPRSVCVYHDCPMDKAGETCPMLVLGEDGETVECPYCSAKIKMHGEYLGTLVPEGYASVLISPSKQQLIGIRTRPVRAQELKRSLRTSARVAYDPALYEAQIDYLREYRTSLGTLRSRELAFKNLVDSRWEAPRVEVAKSKLVLMGMDDDSIRQLVESSKADDALLYLEPKGPVWVYADVFESEVSWIRKGDRVKLGLSSVYGKSYEGRVHSIGSMVDPATRRIRVSILLQNDGTLKSEMLLDAVIESSAGKGLAVPEEAVFFTGTAAIVFVDKGKGLFEPRDVLVGIKAGDHFEIKSGLVEGESVVVNGNFLLDSESRLKASLKQQAEIHVGHGGSHD